MIKKTLQELTIKDNFMFAAVMEDENNCRRLLEIILGFPISKVRIDTEKSIVYHPEYKSVRLDIFAKDNDNTCYNVEMQQLAEPDIARRSRYYHSQIDMEQITAGTDYDDLPDSYVIFICDFDPFGNGRYQYTYTMTCDETKETLDDGTVSIFLSTKGTNDSEVSAELKNFLRYVAADLSDSTKDFSDEYVRNLQKSVSKIKSDREIGERYMLFKELLKDERAAGKAEGIAEGISQGISIGNIEGKAEFIIDLLSELEPVSDNLFETIMAEKNPERLSIYHKAAAKADSIDMFRKETGL